MKTRTLSRWIENHFEGGPYLWTTDDQGQWVFQNRAGRMIGVIDRGTHFDVHDIANPKDTPEKPTMKLNRKLKVIHV